MNLEKHTLLDKFNIFHVQKLVTHMLKCTFYVAILLAFIGCSNMHKEPIQQAYPISSIDIRNVVITDNFWLPKIKIIQDSTILYAFKKCEEEGRFDNFLIAGNQISGKSRGYMPFDDTYVYKIIEGASYSLISNPNPILESLIDSMIAIIKIGQEPDGYITTWFTIDRKNPPAPWVTPSETKWGNEESSHELYNSGHLFEAAAAHYTATGKRNFLDIAIKNADLLVKNFGPNKLSFPPGHQIVETGLIKLYTITHKQEYVVLAKFFLDARGDSTNRKSYGIYSQDHLPVLQQREAVGHAVRAVYMYAAMTDIAAFYKDTNYLKATLQIWKNILHKKMYLTGGIGALHDGESFGKNYELPNATAYNETCAAIGNVYWNHRLFLLTGESKFYDVIERVLYNGLLSGLSLDGKNFFYANPLESDGSYTFNHNISCTRSPWFDCSCCPTNLIRFIPSIPGLIYAKKTDEVYINLYMSNNATIDLDKNKLNIIQKTNYPWNGDITVIVNPEKKSVFTIKLRVPGWAQNQVTPGDLYMYSSNTKSNIQLLINGTKQTYNVMYGYITITREWQKGDTIELFLPMSVRKVYAHKLILDNKNNVAFEYGPLVYCGEQIDNPTLNSMRISQNDSCYIREKTILSNTIVTITNVSADKKELTLIPYYMWSNRGTNSMKVWFPLKEK